MKNLKWLKSMLLACGLLNVIVGSVGAIGGAAAAETTELVVGSFDVWRFLVNGSTGFLIAGILLAIMAAALPMYMRIHIVIEASYTNWL